MTAESDYADIRGKAMLDLVRDPRQVVYAADDAIAALEAENEKLKAQLDQCVWMLHTAAQEYMTGSRAVISWTDYIRQLESRWTAREEAGDE